MILNTLMAAVASAAFTGSATMAADPAVAAQVARQIEQVMAFPEAARRRGESGVVHVSFRTDADGMPTDVRVVRRSFWPALNQAARKTIRIIGPIAGVPVGQRLRAVLKYGFEAGDGPGQGLAAELDRARLDIARSELARTGKP